MFAVPDTVEGVSIINTRHGTESRVDLVVTEAQYVQGRLQFSTEDGRSLRVQCEWMLADCSMSIKQ